MDRGADQYRGSGHQEHAWRPDFCALTRRVVARPQISPKQEPARPPSAFYRSGHASCLWFIAAIDGALRDVRHMFRLGRSIDSCDELGKVQKTPQGYT